MTAPSLAPWAPTIHTHGQHHALHTPVRQRQSSNSQLCGVQPDWAIAAGCKRFSAQGREEGSCHIILIQKCQGRVVSLCLAAGGLSHSITVPPVLFGLVDPWVWFYAEYAPTWIEKYSSEDLFEFRSCRVCSVHCCALLTEFRRHWVRNMLNTCLYMLHAARRLRASLNATV